MEKICKLCREPFRQYTSTQNMCGSCTYKHNIEIANRSKKKALRRQGSGYKWSHAKKQWLNDHPPIDNLYYCHYCGMPLTIEPNLLDMGVEYLTLDHVEPRGGNPHKKYLDTNLVACCGMDNGRKGSRSYENYCREFYPRLLNDNNNVT